MEGEMKLGSTKKKKKKKKDLLKYFNRIYKIKKDVYMFI
jgi:hypothetical protein